jgi:RNA polymerase sigma factor (sigma-70 family)
VQLVKNDQEDSELSLWQQFRAGDGSALEKLMAVHFRGLFHYGTKFTANREFIKDCVQDLFLDLWNRRHLLHEQVMVKAYLMASLRRRIHRDGQAMKRFAEKPIDENFNEFVFELSVEEAIIQVESVQALSQEIKTLLENLPPRQKEVIYLKFFEDMDREQIAKVMDINSQSVSNLLQTAYKQLKTTWKPAYLAILLLLFNR